MGCRELYPRAGAAWRGVSPEGRMTAVKSWLERKVSAVWLVPITAVLFFYHFVHLSTPAAIAIIALFAVAMAADASRDSA
jgi:hypothetical protein